jgi:hypothetical protein
LVHAFYTLSDGGFCCLRRMHKQGLELLALLMTRSYIMNEVKKSLNVSTREKLDFQIFRILHCFCNGSLPRGSIAAKSICRFPSEADTSSSWSEVRNAEECRFALVADHQL